MSHMSKVTGCWKDPADPGQLCVSFDLASMQIAGRRRMTRAEPGWVDWAK